MLIFYYLQNHLCQISGTPINVMEKNVYIDNPVQELFRGSNTQTKDLILTVKYKHELTQRPISLIHQH